MLNIKVKIVSYDKTTNTCEAKLLNGDIVPIDPFVSCAIPMSDEECSEGKGFSIVGSSYLLTKYSVCNDYIVPHEDGMIEVER